MSCFSHRSNMCFIKPVYTKEMCVYIQASRRVCEHMRVYRCGFRHMGSWPPRLLHAGWLRGQKECP